MANNSMLYILVMRIMLINTQGMVYISTVSFFFSQLPKIKIAFNSYIYKYSDSSLYGSDESGVRVFRQSGLAVSLVGACAPHVPARIALQWDHVPSRWQKASMLVGGGSRGWGFVFQPALGELAKPIPFNVIS